jgi:hypothetical protein
MFLFRYVTSERPRSDMDRFCLHISLYSSHFHFFVHINTTFQFHHGTFLDQLLLSRDSGTLDPEPPSMERDDVLL